MGERRDVLAPCGIYCGCCPSLGKTCKGCGSEDKGQKRTSKWGCKVRTCCYETQKKDYCIECAQFPCKIHKKKLTDSHPDDPRFDYRRDIPENFSKMNELGIDDYLKYQQKRWACPHCGGIVYMYYYRCGQCGKEVKV
jgi:hypothetical protein